MTWLILVCIINFGVLAATAVLFLKICGYHRKLLIEQKVKAHMEEVEYKAEREARQSRREREECDREIFQKIALEGAEKFTESLKLSDEQKTWLYNYITYSIESRLAQERYINLFTWN